MLPIYLASESSRRSELLHQIGIPFDVLRLHLLTTEKVTEEVLANESAKDYVARVATEKVMLAQRTMIKNNLPQRPILAADTTVVVDQKILGKPSNKDEAIIMMQLLSGKTHQVLTHVVLHHNGAYNGVTSTSLVKFHTLSEEIINAYVLTKEPYDKAGGYGIQGLAAMFIEHISGSYSGIMGLPLFETAQLLAQADIQLLG